ncbi:oligosaccharide flippase family protein [Pleomorphovibrio marinus]|uniref:oligosaccharide flippase family protein n=1 Tax=Pleomorphovibrio marinus TaxID=2164132 RepID=UPI000E0B7F97|nr:oligosaccharide flippase family protein [Pleomorphovibrio marinus]
MGDSLRSLVFAGIFRNIVQLAVNKSFGFLVKLVLARLLFPEEFGLVGMAVVFTGFINVLNDVGIGAALIQKKEKDLKEFYT